MSSSILDNNNDNQKAPKVTRDPRFIAGRKLVQGGLIDDATVELFGLLCEESRTKYGDAHVEAAPAYYEYGNVLLRSHDARRERQNDNNNENEQEEHASETTTPSAAATAVDADDEDSSKKPAATTSEGNVEETEGSDLDLALEMMENAYSILMEYDASSSSSSSSSSSDNNNNQAQQEYSAWVDEQLPRVLSGIGDALTSLERHADAADAYSQALEKRQTRLDTSMSNNNKESSLTTLDILKAHRLVVDATISVAEALLACDPDQDVVTTETKALVVKKEERVEFSRGYYDKARDALQETVFYMGKVAARGIDVEEEKENVCFIATLVMHLGEMLAAIDEESSQQEGQQSAAKKLKPSK